LRPEEIKSRLDEVAKHTRDVYFHVKGEPLLSPYLKEALDEALSHRLNVHLVTNGLLLPIHGELVLNHPSVKTVTISLHSLSELDASIRTFHLQHLKSWLDSVQDHHPNIRLRVWDGLSANFETSRTLIKELTGFELEEKPRRYFRHSLRSNVHIQSDVRFEWPTLDDLEKHPVGRCKAGLMMLAVLVDGTTTPCCLDGEGIINLGNIDETSIEAMIDSNRYRRFIQGMNDRKPSEALCRACSYKLRFETKPKENV
jgi:radical SAM protein with 4Fe4S-binding SPASM domain